MAGRGRGQDVPPPAAKVDEAAAEDSEDVDEEGESESVAYLEDPPKEKERRLLTRRMFPSKVGGRPAWLVPTNLPTFESGAVGSESRPDGGAEAVADLNCRQCARPLRFLLQIYASRGDDRKEAFHRVLHLFVCTSCQPNQARLYRAQLPRANAFYSPDPPDADAIAKSVKKAGDRDPELDLVCCRLCGLPWQANGDAASSGSSSSAAGACAECARRARNGDGPPVLQERELSSVEAEYPEEEEEEEDELPPKGAGKGSSTGSTAAAAAEDGVEEFFTPGAARAKGGGRDLVAEADSVLEAARRKGASEAVIQKLEEYRAKVAESSENAMDASEQAVFEEYSREKGERDKVYSKFHRFACANNGHVMRYSYGGRPLWFCSLGRLPGPPPPCPSCGADRIFEFQVQPQLIALLRGTGDLAERLDFGIICCYVCSKSCDAPPDRPYLEELAFVQAEPSEAWLPKA